MQATHGEQCRDGRLIGAHAAVGEDEDVPALGDEFVGFGADFRHRLFQAGRALPRIKEDLDGGGFELPLGHALELGEVFVAEDRRLELDQVAAFRLRIEQVALGPDGGDGRRDDLLADAVDGRVRDLGEELLEVVVEQLRLVREHGERDVRAHGTDGFHAVLAHGDHELAQVFKAVTKGLLALQHGFVIRGIDRFAVLDVRQLHEVLVKPLAVGFLGGDLRLDLVVRHDAAFFHVHDEHFAGLQAAFELHILRRDGQHARFGGHDHEVVFRDVVARRAQAIAVQRGTHHGAVREGHGSRAVPRFHEAGMVFVEGLTLLIHRLMAAPRLRNHHHHRMRQRAAAHEEQFEHVVEHRRVGTAFVHDREDFVHVIEQRAFQQRLAGLHPVDVAPQRVDFAVVGDVTVGMRALPAREGVRRESGVHQRQCGLHVRVLKVEEISADLLRHQHAFINQRAGGKAGAIPEVVDLRRANGSDGALADDIELPLKGLLVRAVAAALYESHAHEGLAGFRRVTDHGIVHRHVAPAQHLLTFLGRDLFESLCGSGTPVRVR